ncbi:MAG: hypothetical protein KDE28_28225, partial [Anaerolineales bacterium]|nr:hypothetical protein [Anaerolineales bacterium]
TRPVKVYYFAYANTIQEDALHLVAAKVAASLRVNGDTVGDDSLAELDELAAGDLVTTLARIVTGETQLAARSLQQAFAEANASLRQANTIIGEYRMMDEVEAQQTLAGCDAGPQLLSDQSAVAQPANGISCQPSLFGRDRPVPQAIESVHATPKPAERDSRQPPVPRPRLILSR